MINLTHKIAFVNAVWYRYVVCIFKLNEVLKELICYCFSTMPTLDQAVALAPYNICVNAILPGIIHTNLPPQGISLEDYYVSEAKVIPMRGLGTPEDIAGAAVFPLNINAKSGFEVKHEDNREDF